MLSDLKQNLQSPKIMSTELPMHSLADLLHKNKNGSCTVSNTFILEHVMPLAYRSDAEDSVGHLRLYPENDLFFFFACTLSSELPLIPFCPVPID